MDANELANLGLNPADLRTFDPTGRIVNEQMNANRGRWSSADSGGLTAKFSLKVTCCTTGPQQAEIFGAANSIVDIPNDSLYSGIAGIVYRPFTVEQILCLIGEVAIKTDAAALQASTTTPTTIVGDIIPPSMVIYDDRTGNLVWIAGDSTGFKLSDWAAFFTSQAPLVPGTANVIMVISCSQRPYKALMADLKDLVLLVKQTKITYPDEDGKNNIITLTRPKSFGGSDSNTIEPENYFEPENNQSKVLNVTDQYFVDKLTTLSFLVNGNGGGNNLPVNFNFTVSAYQNNGVMLM